MPARVFVVGSSNTDLVVPCSRLPGPGETVIGGDLVTFAGGKGANQAVAAARAGAAVRFVGCFGDDERGRARRAELEAEGIDCSGCTVAPGAPSGVALIGTGARGENLILVSPGANSRLDPVAVRAGLKDLHEEDVVLASLEVPMTAISTAFALAEDPITAPTVKAVDTVGAGDCFNGCLAAFLSRRPYEVEDALQFAVVAASLQVTRPGAQAAMPTREEIEAAMVPARR